MASELRRPGITATCSPVPRSAPSRSSAPCGEHFSRRRLSEDRWHAQPGPSALALACLAVRPWLPGRGDSHASCSGRHTDGQSYPPG